MVISKHSIDNVRLGIAYQDIERAKRFKYLRCGLKMMKSKVEVK